MTRNQVKDYNLRFPMGSHFAEIDLRDNPQEHLGFEGAAYWEAIHAHAAEAPVVKGLVAGLHSVTAVNVAASLIDRRALQHASTATVDGVLAGTRAQALFERVG